MLESGYAVGFVLYSENVTSVAGVCTAVGDETTDEPIVGAPVDAVGVGVGVGEVF